MRGLLVVLTPEYDAAEAAVMARDDMRHASALVLPGREYSDAAAREVCRYFEPRPLVASPTR